MSEMEPTQIQTGSSIFRALPELSPDRARQFQEDPRKEKLDLRIGEFVTNTGSFMEIPAVSTAEQRAIVERQQDKGSYVPTRGLKGFPEQLERFVLGELYEQIAQRTVTFQTNGAFPALRLAAEFINNYTNSVIACVAEPTLASQRRVFEAAGLPIERYVFLDTNKNTVNVQRMCNSIEELPDKQLIVLQNCNQNPTGFNLQLNEWTKIATTIRSKGHIALFDNPYQGYGVNFQEDTRSIQEFIKLGIEVFIASSLGKTFLRPDMRIGGLTYCGPDSETTKTVARYLSRDTQNLFGPPSAHDASIARELLNSPTLLKLLDESHTEVREILSERRYALFEELSKQDLGIAFKHITQQNGFYVFTGLSKAECLKLREEYAIYIVSDGRLSLAATPLSKIPQIADAITNVRKS